MKILHAICKYDLELSDIKFYLDDIKGKDYLTTSIEAKGEHWLVIHEGKHSPSEQDLDEFLTY